MIVQAYFVYKLHLHWKSLKYVIRGLNSVYFLFVSFESKGVGRDQELKFKLSPINSIMCNKKQGCALAELSGPWHLTFALG